MNKKSLMLSISIIAILIIAGSSIAYFNSQDTKDNVFTVGNVDIELTETEWEPDENHIIAAEASWDKNPAVENVGKNPAYVRIHVKISEYEKMKAVLNGQDPSALFEGLSDQWEADTANPKIEGSDATYTYYYQPILGVGESSDALFTKITFPQTIDEVALLELSETFTMSIYADGVQSEGFNSIEEAFAAFDAEQ